MRPYAPPRWLAPLCVGGLCFALRLPALGRLPSPAGDEGNWALLGLSLARNSPAALPPDAAFVSRLFAWLVALSFRLSAPSWVSARLVLVIAFSLGAMGAAALVTRRDALRAPWLVGALVAVHPWGLWWSRTVSVPYALAAAAMWVGVLVWRRGLETQRAWLLLVAGQCLGLAMQCTPLALLGFATVALGTGLTAPSTLRRPRFWLALGAGGLHGFAFVTGLLHMPSGARQRLAAPLSHQLFSLLNQDLAMLSGVATVRHFVGAPGWLGGLSAGLTGLALLALWPRAARASSRWSLAAWAVTLFGLPLLLSPGRAWHMPALDSDRYGFVWLVPWVLTLDDAADDPARRRRWASAAVVLGAALLGLGSLARALDGPRLDGGPLAHQGGAYRGWQPYAPDAALVDAVYARVRDDARGAPAQILYADYAFHAIRFVNASHDAPITHGFEQTRALAPRRGYAVFFTDAAFTEGPAAAWYRALNRRFFSQWRADAIAPVQIGCWRRGAAPCAVELWRAE